MEWKFKQINRLKNLFWELSGYLDTTHPTFTLQLCRVRQKVFESILINRICGSVVNEGESIYSAFQKYVSTS